MVEIERDIIQTSVEDTIRILEDCPVKGFIVPQIALVQVMNRVSIAHLSIERTIKFLIRESGGTFEEIHGLGKLYQQLVLQRRVVLQGNSWADFEAGNERVRVSHDERSVAEEEDLSVFSEYVLADKGYDSQGFRQHILERGMTPVIPPRSNRKQPCDYDAHLYRERHLVECFINKIKHYRRVFSRFEKLDTRYLGFLHFTAALIWLR